ncbi:MULTISPECIES: ribosomal protein L7/L12 [unclassified Coleofasciculus]|uniref:ribosomal protein L7/L12 n=1 Tax=unclassified Coleofasciculus TaxID=2692782 RepID=UPI001881BE75|nr:MULTISPECIES: ribosomal protein L7/L12 [unclassified Coleofasciculus]MBE9129984.1 ribosomal protein L7/L12 [Coleofasciculus sp. LEGE 07081]MBE9151209.1 ribosomal protein L7/L12 [Coleofasciculus sp. LEGE 07092]
MLDTAIEQETSTIMFFDNTNSGTDWRIRQLEKKIDLILQHLGIEYEEAPFQERLKYLISANQKVAAITELQQQTGMGLKEAKNTIEATEKEIN